MLHRLNCASVRQTGRAFVLRRPPAVCPGPPDDHGAFNRGLWHRRCLTRLHLGWVTAGIAADHGYLQYHFLQPLVYVTLGCLYLAPVHASCVALKGKGILLCGDSARESTRSPTDRTARVDLRGDDAAYLVRRARGAQVIGRPHHIRFRSSAKTIFPELSAFPEVARQNGNMDLELSTSDLRLDSVAPTTEVAMLVSRREAGSPVRLDPLDRDLAQERFERVINLGPAEVREEQRAALRKLTRLPAYTMTYWDLDAAGIALRKLLRSNSRMRSFVATLLFALTLLAGTVAAQVSASAVAGEVRDESGATVANVSIVITDQATGFSRTVRTDSNGAYVVTDLRPGVYRAVAEREGFTRAETGDLLLTVNQHARLNLTLKVGSARESVTVAATVNEAQPTMRR